nr:hypothetical protein [Tanacetum cinerariifolium]
MSEGLKYRGFEVSHGSSAGTFERCSDRCEVHDPKDPWAFKEEILLADDIAANVSRAGKKKCRVVCRTHGVGSTHHAMSDGVLVSMPIVAPQGLAILLADAGTQTETSEDGVSPRTQSPRQLGLQPAYAAGTL